MGEVYRARDAKLNRDVALKILSDAFVTDPDRLARFHREAQVLASLNHPNIAAIYGFEDTPSTGSGPGGARQALVLELVEGPTLADRIAQGPIALPDALPIAKQIADALEAAHDLGIVHRDLKPANIKVRADGTVKVLDFGLAKALGPEGASASAGTMNSPTLTARATQMGMILGTAAYMSPEQAKGKAVDKRADIWAFGCVLYEMLSGRRPFTGDDTSDVLAGHQPHRQFHGRRRAGAVLADGRSDCVQVKARRRGPVPDGRDGRVRQTPDHHRLRPRVVAGWTPRRRTRPKASSIHTRGRSRPGRRGGSTPRG